MRVRTITDFVQIVAHVPLVFASDGCGEPRWCASHGDVVVVEEGRTTTREVKDGRQPVFLSTASRRMFYRVSRADGQRGLRRR